MKKVIFIFAIILTALTSCEKEEITVSETSKPQNKEILTFATQEEFEETLAKVNAMSKEERLAWEKEQGFKSFGTICDEFYETIDPERFKSSEEVKAFVAKHSDKIEFYTSSDGEIYCVTKHFKIKEKYMINKNLACKIGEQYYTFHNKSINTNNLFLKKATNTVITEADAYGNASIGNDTYRIHTWIDTYLFQNEHRVAILVKNFSRSLGIWWLKDAMTTINFTFTTSDSQNNTNSSSFNTIKYFDNYEFLAAYTAPIYSTSPYFLRYNCHTENRITKKDGRSCVCVADMILN